MKKVDRKYFQTGGITIEVRSDLPMTEKTFHPKIKAFEVDGPGKDTVVIRHHFQTPKVEPSELGTEIYRHPPWAIFKDGNRFVYLWIVQHAPNSRRRRIAYFSADHAAADIYNDSIRKQYFLAGNVESVTLFPTDQILTARLLADRGGCILHSAGLVINGKGFLFVGHSDAGKSTITGLLRDRGTILCDDRNIVRLKNGTFRVYGTWSHGDVKDVSPVSAPLAGIFFLNQAGENRIDAVKDPAFSMNSLLSCVVKPFVTPDWWQNVLSVAEKIADRVACHQLFFDRSGGIRDCFAGLSFDS